MKNNTITSLNLHQQIGYLLLKETRFQIDKLKYLTDSDISVFIDKIWIQTNEIDEDSLGKDFTKKYASASKYYGARHIYRGKENRNLSIIIFKDAKDSARALYRHKIEINPRHFKGYSSFSHLVSRLLTPEGLKSHRISRVDISFCFPKEKVSVDSFNLCTYFQFKHYVGHYKNKEKYEDTDHPDVVYNKGNLSTIMVGKKPHRLSIYDRSIKLKIKESTINFEIQFSDHKVKNMLNVERIQELSNLVKVKPLAGIIFKDITNPKNKEDFYLNKTNEPKLAFAITNAFRSGLHSARSSCNKQMSRKFDEKILYRISDITCYHTNKSFKKVLTKKYGKDLRDYFDN